MSRKLKLHLQCLFLALLTLGCTTHKILQSQLELSLYEKEELELASVKTVRDIQYFKVNRIHSPSEEALYHEGAFLDRKEFEQSFDLVKEVVDGGLSRRQTRRLDTNCAKMTRKFTRLFPMAARTIPCIPWWNAQRAKANKQSQHHTRRPRLRLSYKNRFKYYKYTGYSLYQIIKAMKFRSEKDIFHFAQISKSYFPKCGYRTTTAALLLKLENSLPEKQAYYQIDNIYRASERCFRTSDDVSEKVHFRLGLFYLLHGKLDESKRALRMTFLAKKPRENTRSLFWLGVVSELTNDPLHKEMYWEKLLKLNPLSIQGIIAALQLHQDPANYLSRDETFTAQNRVEGGWNQTNVQFYLLDYLIARKQFSAAKKWAKTIANTMDEETNPIILYLAYWNAKLGNSSNGILLLSKYYRNYDDYPVSPEILKILYPLRFGPEILGAKADIDPVLILSLIRQESAFDPSARSPANAYGLMQLLPSTARHMDRSVRRRQLYNPTRNIKLGTKFLKTLLHKYEGRIDYSLAAYNAGGGALAKWRKRVPTQNRLLFIDYIPYRETRNYVSIIYRNYYWYYRMIAQKDDKISDLFIEKSGKAHWKSKKIITMAKLSHRAKNCPRIKELLHNIYTVGEK